MTAAICGTVSVSILQAAAYDLEAKSEAQVGFTEWVGDNSHLVCAFMVEALRVAAKRRHYSARTILEVIRHESAIADRNGEGFKVNNNRAPDLARLFAQAYPAHRDLFELRARTSF